MPAKSKAQQKLFALVYLYKQGKLPSASRKIRQIAKHISDDDAKKYASTSHDALHEIKKIIYSNEYIIESLKDIQETKTPGYIKGKLIDNYTASILLTVISNLNPQYKNHLLTYPINEMVMLAYKLLVS